ncbi:MAG: 50S ribosomal protein L18 [Buchnera aphidicola (Nurudea shiraii)]
MDKKQARIRRASRARHKLKILKSVRLIVHRTPRHIYAQIVSFDNSSVLVVASTLEKKLLKFFKYTGNKEAASVIGAIIAKRALEKGINVVAFDRSGFRYHGRVQALADEARKVGLKF